MSPIPVPLPPGYRSTTSLLAGDVMDRAAALLNDPARTDYTYLAQLPYLNMAIDELLENLQESNSSPTNTTTNTLTELITVPISINRLYPVEERLPCYPPDMVEIQEIGERLKGTDVSFTKMTKLEFIELHPAQNNLGYWSWENQYVLFNPNGALTDREIAMRYVSQPIQLAKDETSIIGVINSRSYLSYKTAALCAMFIGENETRAGVLEDQATKAIERLTGINNKGRQQIMTRHRPFRAAYKMRGY